MIEIIYHDGKNAIPCPPGQTGGFENAEGNGEVHCYPLLDGVTLSGGEPMCQPEACRTIADAAHAKHLNVWCYTGFTLDALLKENDPARMALLHGIDVLVDGRFVQEQKSLSLLYRGSSNQRLIDVPKTLAAGEITLWTPPVW